MEGCKNHVLLTIKQVCRMFDVTTGMTIYHWVARGFPKKLSTGGRNPTARYDEGQFGMAKFNSEGSGQYRLFELC